MLSEWDKRWIVEAVITTAVSADSQSLLDVIRNTSKREDNLTRNPNNEWHITLYPTDCKLILEMLGE
jgi:hypothetical protein